MTSPIFFTTDFTDTAYSSVVIRVIRGPKTQNDWAVGIGTPCLPNAFRAAFYTLGYCGDRPLDECICQHVTGRPQAAPVRPARGELKLRVALGNAPKRPAPHLHHII